jgi:hypothetical protein
MKEFTIKNLKADDALANLIRYARRLIKDGRNPLAACIEDKNLFAASWLFKNGYVAKSDQMRDLACMDPGYAYLYARYIQRAPCDHTRDAACMVPGYAYLYAHHVDGGSHPATLAAACMEPQYAYLYAHYVHGGPHPATLAAASRDTYYAGLYREWEESLQKP